ncbi:MAG TPA: MG2 domain-containing protein, partial [Candidatus Ozemobacteraceae bacterium]|nr:MG2 domain-containing protein [Candidatus Ozemobacteraceae bacterium]
MAGKPLPRIKVDYTNIDKVHFRLVKADWKQLLNEERWSTPEDVRWDKWERLMSYSAAKEWAVTLPPTPDYLARTEFTPFPEMKKGFYHLIASWKDSFAKDNNTLFLTTVFVSDLAMITRNRWGNCETLVVHNESGTVAHKAEVRVYRQDNEGHWRDRGTVKPDANGWCSVKGENGFLLTASQDDDFIAMPNSLSTWQPSEESMQTQVFFFTDRAIYRPGQMIQFKGLLVRIDRQQNQYEVRPNQNVNVVFFDVNRQQIVRQTFTTNEAGSFSGTFTAPTDRLPGQMQIVAEAFGGSAVIRVEEYKRPKFKVTLDIPSEGGKLGEKLTVKGNAMAFTGAAIDGAKVKYRVVREVVMPWWCWWRVVRTPSQEIAHGVVTTDIQGKFEIPFVPAPNRTIPESDQPVFTFRISADVTDSTGETRSGQQAIRLGYTALELSLSAGQWLEADQEFKLGVQSQTLDGKGVPANGTLQVFSLKQPVKTVRKAFYDAEGADASDYRRWEQDKVVHESPFNTSVDGTFALPVKLPVGAYRAVASARDRFGKTVKTQFDLLI